MEDLWGARKLRMKMINRWLVMISQWGEAKLSGLSADNLAGHLVYRDLQRYHWSPSGISLLILVVLQVASMTMLFESIRFDSWIIPQTEERSGQRDDVWFPPPTDRKMHVGIMIQGWLCMSQRPNRINRKLRNYIICRQGNGSDITQLARQGSWEPSPQELMNSISSKATALLPQNKLAGF